MSLSKEREQIASEIADRIRSERNGLDHEDKLAAGVELRSYARSKKIRDQERARLNGMKLALTYVLGRPYDMQLAEAFITNDPTWEAML